MEVELYIEKLIADGKVSPEYIDAKVAELRAAQPRTVEDVLSLEKRLAETERATLMLIDIALMGGM